MKTPRARLPGFCTVLVLCSLVLACRFDERGISSTGGNDAVTEATDAGADGETDAGAIACPASREAEECDAPTVGEWSACRADVSCGLLGVRLRRVVTHACREGACVSSAPRTESEDCWIDPLTVEGMACGTVTCGTYSECEGPLRGPDQCALEGQKQRVCGGSTCTSIGVCEDDAWIETAPCERPTDGESCQGCGGLPSEGSYCECRGGSCASLAAP